MTFKCYLTAFSVCLIFLTNQAQEKNGALHLKGELRVHDPVMIKQDSTYYIFSTGQGVTMKYSEDMIHWKRTGSVFDSVSLPAWHKKDIPEQDGHLWAPDIHYRNGKYHLYYSVSAWMNFNSSIGYATNTTLDSDDPDYRWVDNGQVISFRNGGEGVNVIDPNVYVAENGKVWLLYGSYQAGLRMVELNPQTGHLKNNPPEITIITTSLGEGVFVIKGLEYYYIFASRGICCKGLDSNYQVVMGRSQNLEGPYLNKDGESWLDNNYTVFLKGDHKEPGRGHNGFFVEEGIAYIVYHAYTRSADGDSLLNIAPLYITQDGWPTTEPTGKHFKMAAFQQKVFSRK
ncbi:arabinan endo-1,5-alpha-L-arabinosidase [Gramella sp. AN32]|uniref:Arabinan endo-1,5-alpha-L-arabinosidase n=1 Tax=Christiangramia antarctica TaxID=2058158 RepID=A0ABW5X133_9FLAO|nr:arabinan endo-1,5-alpha-L-arabinosidase [Gramella sp. AN32]MCM4157246.1 arabinan endo-1,5-alpha-L-arabinosidase [Gramella sp. AN32]